MNTWSSVERQQIFFHACFANNVTFEEHARSIHSKEDLTMDVMLKGLYMPPCSVHLLAPMWLVMMNIDMVVCTEKVKYKQCI